MFRRVLPVLLAFALAFTAAACDTVKPYVKTSKRFYKDYINTDPSIDLKDQGISDPTTRKLADLFTPVDERLEFLLRALSAQDLPPSPEWCQSFMDAFPWLSGMAIVTDAGAVPFKLPSFSLKQVDFTPLLELDKLYKARKMASVITTTELGAEILIAKPLFMDNEYKGLLVAHFDPGSLAKFSPEPGKLLIVAPGAMLWGGDDPSAAQTLSQMKWKDILKSEVAGDQKIGGTTYLWQSRFVAQNKIVYAVSTVTESKAPKQKPEQAPAETPAAKPE